LDRDLPSAKLIDLTSFIIYWLRLDRDLSSAKLPQIHEVYMD